MTPDIPVTIFVTVLLSALAWLLPRRHAIVPLNIVICSYPSNLLCPPAALQLTPLRIVCLVVFIRAMTRAEIVSKFRWTLADTAAVVYMGLTTAAQFITSPDGPVAAINNRAGFFLSHLLPFWCVRLIVTDRAQLYIYLKTFLWTALPLGILACYQSNTGDSPWGQIMQYGSFWVPIHGQWLERRKFLGMNNFRASAPFQQCIMFGWFFAIQITQCTNLFWEKRKLWPWVLPWLMLPVAVVATVSAGPMMMAGMSFMIASLFPWRQYSKVGFGTAISAYMAVAIFARRAPMEIVASFGLDQSSSFYRVNLIKFTTTVGMTGHWIFGWGYIPLIYDYMHHDLCIQWICLAVFHGICGVVGFYLFVICCGVNMWKAREKAQSIEDQWLLWSLMAVIIASLLAMQLVALFGEMFFIYHMLMGVVANTRFICGSGAGEERQVGVLAEIDGRQVLLRYKLRPGQKLAVVHPGSRMAP